MKFLAALSTGLLLAAYSLPALASDAELKLDVNEDGVTDELDVAAITIRTAKSTRSISTSGGTRSQPTALPSLSTLRRQKRPRRMIQRPPASRALPVLTLRSRLL